MNIERLSRRGMNYLKASVINWQDRSYKLQKAWCLASEQNSKDPLYMKRYVLAANVLGDWVRAAKNIYYEMEKHVRELKQREGEMIVMLECPTWECRYGPDAVGYGVKYKDYEPGKMKCDKCGHELELREQQEIDDMLFQLLNK